MVEAAVAFAKENGDRFVEELTALLRIPSISTDPARVGDVRRAAEFVAAELRRIGMENVRLIETSTTSAKRAGKGHPLVYGDWLNAGAGEADGALLRALRCAAGGAAGGMEERLRLSRRCGNVWECLCAGGGG